MDLKDIGIINGIIVAWGAVFYGLAMLLMDARLARAIHKFEEDAIDPIREELQSIKIETVKVQTWLDASKARLAGYGIAEHNSPYAINVSRLGEMIETSGYTPDPHMLDYFREIVEDPDIPDDDVKLWNLIETRFGLTVLAQDVQRFGAPGEDAMAIWILCIRRAQQIGVDALLKEIKVLR